MELMDSFTLAQIMDFITAAQEANAINVLAALMDYKNSHFSDYDPMEEFTLDFWFTCEYKKECVIDGI